MQCFPCGMMSVVSYVVAFLSHIVQNMLSKLPPQLLLAIDMFTCCYLVVMHLFPVCIIWNNKLKYPSECTVLKVVLKIVMGAYAQDPHSVVSCIQCSLSILLTGITGHA